MNRRKLLGGVGAAGAALTAAGAAAQAAPAVNLDAALLQAGAAYDAVENGRLFELSSADDAAFTPEQQEAHDTALRAEMAKLDAPMLTLATTRAVTVDGMRVKARVLLGMLGRDLSPPRLGKVDENDLVRSIVADLLEGVPG